MLMTKQGLIIPSRTGVQNLRGLDLMLPEPVERPTPIPYQTPLSPEEQEIIKRDICIYMFDNDLVKLEDISRIEEMLNHHLTPDEWNEVSNHPKDYWFVEFARQLTDQRSQSIIGYDLSKKGFFGGDKNSHKRYMINQMVWFERARELYPFGHGGKEASLDDLYSEIVPRIGALFRAFCGLKMGVGEDVNYMSHEGLRRVSSFRRFTGGKYMIKKQAQMSHINSGERI